MPTAYPDAAVQTICAALTNMSACSRNDPPFGAGTVFLGQEIPQEQGVPAKAIFVETKGGLRNSRLLGGSSDERLYSVRVLVRSDHYDYAGGLTLARAAHAALHCATVTGYVSCVVAEPEPDYVGVDGEFYHRWQMTVLLLRYT